ncbi:hypothetical protein IFM89_014983 [Coptis chinensis]|uniref:Cyclic nucleotide-binding domain-containing protein n=1 Tax=Coptis chinensis TaxID=261450 RepID=A0A835LME5_9MAGN|nr:hypothetical protein IFM89_014983 [Coptis chinensis]
MDEHLLYEICDRLKQVLYTKNSFVIGEGDPVDDILFIVRGKLLTTTKADLSDFMNYDYLKAGDFCGQELLTWALVPHSSSNRPISTRTVQALSEVVAFALTADDLKSIASNSQFRMNLISFAEDR